MVIFYIGRCSYTFQSDCDSQCFLNKKVTWAHTQTPLCACTNIIHVHTLTEVSENVQRGISKVISIKGKMRLQNEGENNILKTVF